MERVQGADSPSCQDDGKAGSFDSMTAVETRYVGYSQLALCEWMAI